MYDYICADISSDVLTEPPQLFCDKCGSNQFFCGNTLILLLLDFQISPSQTLMKTLCPGTAGERK